MSLQQHEIKSPQTLVADQNLTLITCIHCVSQIVTANENLDVYSSLHGFQHAQQMRGKFL
jgi:hypothetical protein